jgi:hypothetical protein
MSWAKKYYNATLCYLASLSFFWRGFLFVALATALLFFYLQKINVLHVRSLTKTMTKKVEGNTAKQPAFGAACRALWVGLFGF